MHAKIEKTKENKSRKAANPIDQKHIMSDPGSQFEDNRPETIAQRKLNELANNSYQAKQATQLQNSIDGISVIPIQKKEINSDSRNGNSAVIQRAKWKWDRKGQRWELYERDQGKRLSIEPQVKGFVDGEIYDDVNNSFTGQIALTEKDSLLEMDRREELLGSVGSDAEVVPQKKFTDAISSATEYNKQVVQFIQSFENFKISFWAQYNELTRLNGAIQYDVLRVGDLYQNLHGRSACYRRILKNCREAAQLIHNLTLTINFEDYFSENRKNLMRPSEIPLYDLGIEIKSSHFEPYSRVSDERSDALNKGLAVGGAVKAGGSLGTTIGYGTTGLKGIETAGQSLGTIGGGLETLEGFSAIHQGISRPDTAVGKLTTMAEGSARTVKGGASAAYFGGQFLGHSAEAMAATPLSNVIPGAALALGGVQVLSGTVGAIRGQNAINTLEQQELNIHSKGAYNMMHNAMTAKRNENISNVAKGAVAVAGGAVLLASLTNPVGWMLLAAAGLIGFSIMLAEKWSQRSKGKAIAEMKNREYQITYRQWVNGGMEGPEPQLNERYDLSRITWKSWRTFSDIYKEELVDQANEVAQTIYDKINSVSNAQFTDEQSAYIQVVKNLGLRIDPENRLPTIADIRKQLLKRLA